MTTVARVKRYPKWGSEMCRSTVLCMPVCLFVCMSMSKRVHNVRYSNKQNDWDFLLSLYRFIVSYEVDVRFTAIKLVLALPERTSRRMSIASNW
jgi:hypothetical protein